MDNLENVLIPEPERTVSRPVDDAAVFKKRSVEEVSERETMSMNKKVKIVEEATLETSEGNTVETVVAQTEMEVKPAEESDGEEDEEFEIPAIELSGDEDEDGDDDE